MNIKAITVHASVKAFSLENKGKLINPHTTGLVLFDTMGEFDEWSYYFQKEQIPHKGSYPSQIFDVTSDTKIWLMRHWAKDNVIQKVKGSTIFNVWLVSEKTLKDDELDLLNKNLFAVKHNYSLYGKLVRL